MKIHIRRGDLHLTELRTRMPFKYGIATMTRTPHAFVRLHAEIDGQLTTGVAADHLPPKWFTKDPARPIADEVDEMLRVIEHALDSAAGLRGDSPFAVWRQLHQAQAGWGEAANLPPLLTSFGTSLVERALIEAVCRAAGQPFPQALLTGLLGIRLGDIHPSLRNSQPQDFLPPTPLTRITVRHTVGLADPIVDADIPPDERLDDGLPQSLAACIQSYGLRHFKIKVSGEVGRDLDRLARVAGVIRQQVRGDYAFSLDGNEQFKTTDQFRQFWEAIQHAPALQDFLGRLLFVEQPLHRDVALEPAVAGALRDWPACPPLIIDESDGALDSLPRALHLGYAGCSHKNCKGVFKGIANLCLLTHLRRESPGRNLLMSGEDLANIGPVALLQDLTACACLGVASVERNGHHYFAGLSMFPAEVQRRTLEHHGDLYHPGRDGWPTLDIRDGAVAVGSLLVAPFGVGWPLDVEAFPSLAAWRQTPNS
jgi:hypothetical protein